MAKEGADLLFLWAAMDAQSIQRFCIQGTERYLAFLLANDRGLQQVSVTRIEVLTSRANAMFKLMLGQRLFDPDGVSLKLEPPGAVFGPDFFRIIEYDADAKVLVVEILKNELVLDRTHPEGMRVISDLRFLVRNVRQWYAANGLQIQMPEGSTNVPWNSENEREQRTMVSLDVNQRSAVEQSLSAPLTYVWGPPGTGKTKHVLVQTALHLLFANKKVGIFAPTNNALEQAMAAVVDASETAGFERSKFLRVGHPSAKFAAAYGEICEVQGLDRQISELDRQIGIYELVLNYRRGATVLNSAATTQHTVGELQAMIHERRKMYEEMAKLKSNPVARVLHSLDGKIGALNQRLDKLESQINGLLEMIKRTTSESPKLDAILQHMDFTNVQQSDEALIQLINSTSQFLEVNRALAEGYQKESNQEIEERKSSLQNDLMRLKALSVLERIKSASVTGMTLDCFIGRFPDTVLPFDHILLDEAGYAPLVKALTLCRDGTPITFFGDHKQLGPVCEMDEENLTEPTNNSAIVWKKSALFVDQPFVSKDQESCVDQLLRLNDPEPIRFTYLPLNRTYRFGQNLANILSTSVFSGIQLGSAKHDDNLEIICINAVPRGEGELRRENRAEVDAISSYLPEVTLGCADTEDAYVILTPYKNQVALLGRSFLDARQQGRILTVHASQGREWDIVILSLVDGRFNRPWFTDTMNLPSGGLYVMNTAISRARRRLVLVCDQNYWLRQDGAQLLTQLLNAAN